MVAPDSRLSPDALALLIVLDEAAEKDGRVEAAGVAPKLVLDRGELQSALSELEQRRLVRRIDVEGWYRVTDEGRQRLGPGGLRPTTETGATQEDDPSLTSRWRQGISQLRARATRRGP